MIDLSGVIYASDLFVLKGEYENDDSMSDYPHEELIITEEVSSGDGTDGDAHVQHEPSSEAGAVTATDKEATKGKGDSVASNISVTSSTLLAGNNGVELLSASENLQVAPEVHPPHEDSGVFIPGLGGALSGDSKTEAIKEGTKTNDLGPTDATEQSGSVDGQQPEHLPEPPASPVSNTVASSNSTTANAESSTAAAGGTTSVASTATAAAVAAKSPSANRLSIFYAAGTRRLIIDAEVVDKLTILRSEGRIDVAVTVESVAEGGFKGIWVRTISFYLANEQPS